ncbi:hypothetical protein GGS24DRAFT_381636 [Hypoxylon argillaceum]|nr:hypothetical protein GGS24DRAFT_381636 [Hypoxylon argillaceum]
MKFNTTNTSIMPVTPVNTPDVAGMDLLIVGATGMIGEAVLRGAIRNRRISHVYVLATGPLPGYLNMIRKVMIIDPTTMDEVPYSATRWPLWEVEACIWTSEHSPCRSDPTNTDTPPITINTVLSNTLPWLALSKTFRFVYVSKDTAAMSAIRRVVFCRDTRRTLNTTERILTRIERDVDKVKVIIARPAGVTLGPVGSFRSLLGKITGTMDSAHLADSLISLALDSTDANVVTARELRNMWKCRGIDLFDLGVVGNPNHR